MCVDPHYPHVGGTSRGPEGKDGGTLPTHPPQRAAVQTVGSEPASLVSDRVTQVTLADREPLFASVSSSRK